MDVQLYAGSNQYTKYYPKILEGRIGSFKVFSTNFIVFGTVYHYIRYYILLAVLD